jgi:ElaB/YqjD/DUF883 family membrane-anchored ribosome-binding protein
MHADAPRGKTVTHDAIVAMPAHASLSASPMPPLLPIRQSTSEQTSPSYRAWLDEITDTLRSCGNIQEAKAFEKAERARAIRMDESVDHLKERRQQMEETTSTMWSQTDHVLARAITAGPGPTAHLIDHIARSTDADGAFYIKMLNRTSRVPSPHLCRAMAKISPSVIVAMKDHVLTSAITTIAEHGWNPITIKSILRAQSIHRHLDCTYNYVHSKPYHGRKKSDQEKRVDDAYHDFTRIMGWMRRNAADKDAKEIIHACTSGTIHTWSTSHKPPHTSLLKRCIASIQSSIAHMPLAEEPKKVPGRPAATITIPESKRMAAIEGIATWMGNGHIGASSQALASRILIACMGGSSPHEPTYRFPHDADDFMRCEHLMAASKLPTSTLQSIMSDMGGPWKHIAKNLTVARTCAATSEQSLDRIMRWHDACRHHDADIGPAVDATIATSVASATWILALQDAATVMPASSPTP